MAVARLAGAVGSAARRVLVLYALSAPTAFSLTHNSGIGGRPAVLISIPWLFLVPLLTWRVWRGDLISRVLLIFNGVAGYTGMALHVARQWRPLDLWLLADFAAQVALLVSPAVYQRTRPASICGPPRLPHWPVSPRSGCCLGVCWRAW